MRERALEIAKKLDITVDEALEMLAEDKKVDRMTKAKDIDSDLNDKQRKTIKKYTNVARGREVNTSDAYGKKKTRVIKDDEVKQNVINALAETLENIADKVEIANKQKTILFSIGSDNFEIDLKRKRKPKEK